MSLPVVNVIFINENRIIRKWLNLSQIFLEVYEILQLFWACLSKQKSRWSTSIPFSSRDKNARILQILTLTNKKHMNRNFFFYFLFKILHKYSCQNFSVISSLFFFDEFLNLYTETIWTFKCLVSVWFVKFNFFFSKHNLSLILDKTISIRNNKLSLFNSKQ